MSNGSIGVRGIVFLVNDIPLRNHLSRRLCSFYPNFISIAGPDFSGPTCDGAERCKWRGYRGKDGVAPRLSLHSLIWGLIGLRKSTQEDQLLLLYLFFWKALTRMMTPNDDSILFRCVHRISISRCVGLSVRPSVRPRLTAIGLVLSSCPFHIS